MAWDHLSGKQQGENSPSFIHGEAKNRTPEYRSWRAMRTRCENPNHHAFPRYGGRGITVCERWKSYENFLADMGRRPDLSFTLDRIDNNQGYSPDNCRWAGRRTQILNSTTSRQVTYGDVTCGLKEMAHRHGLSHQLLKFRMDKGMSLEEALTAPKRRYT